MTSHDPPTNGRSEAARIEQANPLWIVVFGVYSQQFICFPRFDAPAGTVLITRNPSTLPQRMSKMEQLSRIRDGLRKPLLP